MSATQCFALCLDCWELHYGVPDKNGVSQRDSASTNHDGHAVHIFGSPNDYQPPIRTILAALQAGFPISDGRAEMFSLACAVTAIQPNNGVNVTPPSPSKTHARPELSEPIFPDQTCPGCGIEHPGLACDLQDDLFGSES